MQRIAVIGAMCLAVAGLVAYALGATSGGDIARGQAISAIPDPSGAGSPAPSGGPGTGGAGPTAMPLMGGGAPAAGGAAGAAPAGPTAEPAVRRVRTDLQENQDVVGDVVSPAILKLDKLGYVHLAGVITPAEYFALRSDRAHFEGTESNWGVRYLDNETPDDYTYNTGEEDLRWFVHRTAINRVVTVEKVGEYTLQGAKKEWKMPDVILTFTRPQVLTSDSTDPINLNELVVAETKQIPMRNCQWESGGDPARFDATTQSWLNPKWKRYTGRVAPQYRDTDKQAGRN